MLRKVHGDAATQLVQARRGWDSGPVLRPPAYTVPTWLMATTRVAKLVARATWFAVCHPVLTLTVALGAFLYVRYGWISDLITAAIAAAVLTAWALTHGPRFYSWSVSPPWRGGAGWSCTGGIGNRR